MTLKQLSEFLERIDWKITCQCPHCSIVWLRSASLQEHSDWCDCGGIAVTALCSWCKVQGG